MLALLATSVLQLADLEAPPLVAVDPERPPPQVTAEVRGFADFVDRHLILLDGDSRGFSIRQRERVFHLADDDFAEAFALVPEARALALQAQRNLRIATALNSVGLAAASLASISTAVLPLFVVGGPALGAALVAALIVAVAGVAASVIAMPFQLSAQAQFASAIAVYNRYLVDPDRPAAPDAPQRKDAL